MTALACLKARTQVISTGVGWITLVIGVALTPAPRGSAKFLGWGGRDRPALLIGVADLVVGVGLLTATRRSHWMLGRTLLNVVIALVYTRALANGTPRRKRAVGGACMMLVLTINDYYLSRSLRETEAAYNPNAIQS